MICGVCFGAKPEHCICGTTLSAYMARRKVELKNLVAPIGYCTIAGLRSIADGEEQHQKRKQACPGSADVVNS